MARALSGAYDRRTPPNRDAGPGVAPLTGTYNSLADQADRELFQRAGEDLRARRYLIVPVGAVGQVGGFPIDCDANGLMILPRTMSNGVETESSDSARVYAFINNEAYPIAFSFNADPRGSAKGDAIFYGGRINRLNFYVQNASQDSNQPSMIFVLLKNVTMMGTYGSAQLYGSPSGQASGGTAGVASAGSGAGSPAPPTVTPPGSGGGGAPIGGGGGDGGGGTGRGGFNKL